MAYVLTYKAFFLMTFLVVAIPHVSLPSTTQSICCHTIFFFLYIKQKPKVLNSWICQSPTVHELNYFTRHGLWCNDKKAAKWQVRRWHCFLLFAPSVPDQLSTYRTLKYIPQWYFLEFVYWFGFRNQLSSLGIVQ